ncbi:hypothetical protein [Nannocystis pusilla]|uniref:hypothetical protein n=1 Tax=Nannocystis pusilla TaxID=889268 RepID=UPI001CCB1771|nr:hypothetical protein [Nannocystis pusilla]
MTSLTAVLLALGCAKNPGATEGSVGFCYHEAGGGADTPSIYYEVETGRVFVFPNTPTPPPDGWVDCTCGPPSPEACWLCWDPCSEETSSSG